MHRAKAGLHRRRFLKCSLVEREAGIRANAGTPKEGHESGASVLHAFLRT
jgi:hypothetical protein